MLNIWVLFRCERRQECNNKNTVFQGLNIFKTSSTHYGSRGSVNLERKSKMAASNWKYIGNNVLSLLANMIARNSNSYAHVYKIGQLGEIIGNTVQRMGKSEIKYGGH